MPSFTAPLPENLTAEEALQSCGPHEVILWRQGKPVGKIVLDPNAKPGRIAGQDAGLFEIPDDFDAPIPELEAYFE